MGKASANKSFPGRRLRARLPTAVLTRAPNRVEAGRIVNRHFGERLAIQLDPRGVQPMDELAVAEFAVRTAAFKRMIHNSRNRRLRTRRSRGTRRRRAHQRFLGRAKQATISAPEALGLLEKMAIVERARLKGASAQSPPTDMFFQKDFLMNDLLGNREYLFDQVPALMAIFDNVKTVDELADVLPRMSLVQQGLLGKPMAPMLVLAGVLDTQVPISDIYLLLDKGDTPKMAWINPSGGHLGRQVKIWPDPRIFKEVIIPWLVRTLEAEPVPQR